MRRRYGFSVFAWALAGAAVAASCSSTGGTGWKAQKAYGARMAKKGYWREALFRFEKASKERPNDAELQNDLAVAYESVGETSRALTAYKRALELEPSNAKIKRNYARFAEYYTSVQRAGGGASLPAIPAASAAPPAAMPAAPTPAPTPVTLVPTPGPVSIPTPGVPK